MDCCRVRMRSGEASPSAWVRAVAGSTIEGVVIGVMPFEWDVKVSSKVSPVATLVFQRAGLSRARYTTLRGTTRGTRTSKERWGSRRWPRHARPGRSSRRSTKGSSTGVARSVRLSRSNPRSSPRSGISSRTEGTRPSRNTALSHRSTGRALVGNFEMPARHHIFASVTSSGDLTQLKGLGTTLLRNVLKKPRQAEPLFSRCATTAQDLPSETSSRRSRDQAARCPPTKGCCDHSPARGP